VASVEIRLYGRLRLYAPAQDPRADSVVTLAVTEGESVEGALRRAGIDRRQEVSHIFVNGTLCDDGALALSDGDRVGVFPKNMGLLYV
jgi:hypothetical protein